MKDLKYNFAVKVCAWAASLVAAIIFVVSFVSAYAMFELDIYRSSERELQNRAMREICSSVHYDIICELDYNDKTALNTLIKQNIDEMSRGTNWRYTIEDSDGNLIIGNYEGQVAFEDKNVYNYFTNGQTSEKDSYTVTLYVLSDLKEKDVFYDAAKACSVAYDMRYAVYIIAFISAALFALLLAFLFSSAGYKVRGEGVSGGINEKIPPDVFTLLVLFAVYMNYVALNFADGLGDYSILFAIPVLFVIDYLIATLYLKSVAIHLKLRSLVRSTIIYRALGFVFKPIVYAFKNSRGMSRTAVLCTAVCGVFFILLLLCDGESEKHIILVVCMLVLFFVAALLHSAKLKMLTSATEKIAKGDFAHRVDTSRLYGDLGALGNDVNRINEGLSEAVKDKMKSERLKTELITNVSHDLKTPLTSIISYVDLLEKREIEDEDAKKYVEVLARQSARLKKLTDDLFEAAMASSGSIKIELSRCDVGVLLNQTAGEFEDRLLKAGLSLVVDIPDEAVLVTADPKRLWRVFENLMGNICKYSQENTRVYLTVSRADGRAFIRFKNISRDMLNISPDELTARFVRGDSSRNTEGSGLGLSIAKSLTELQGGRFELRIDGDLFEAILDFPLAQVKL